MSSFALDISAFAKKAGENVNTVVRKVSIDLAKNIIDRSPVDTGRFRANWITSLDAPSTDTTDALDLTGATSIELAIASVADLQTGQTVYIANNLPYAVPLENGHSQQAPNGMVGLAAIEFQSYVDKAVSELP